MTLFFEVQRWRRLMGKGRGGGLSAQGGGKGVGAIKRVLFLLHYCVRKSADVVYCTSLPWTILCGY